MTVGELEYEVLPATRVRKATAKRLRAAVRDKPQVTLHSTLDASALFEYLDLLRRESVGGTRPTLTSVLAVVLSKVLARDPVMNSSLLEDDELRRYAEVHLAVAVATKDGLVTPVLRPNDLVDDFTAARALASLSDIARQGQLKIEHLTPYTFTMTNLGTFGIEYFTPIINPPNIGILGVGKSATNSHKRLPVSLSFDHAAADGVDGAGFLLSLGEAIKQLGVV